MRQVVPYLGKRLKRFITPFVMPNRYPLALTVRSVQTRLDPISKRYRILPILMSLRIQMLVYPMSLANMMKLLKKPPHCLKALPKLVS